MDQEALLDLLAHNGRASPNELAELLGAEASEVAALIERLEAAGVILGYTAVVDPEKRSPHDVAALIEVRITPERGGGFDRIAQRIAQFEQVRSCYLMSGGYDLAVMVEGRDLREVARFVAEKLSTLEGVLSTATHFQLKVYKESGILCQRREEPGRLPVTP
ncbi:MAG TPA: Lrp/AsnC family transcriptional regulator [Verrucomicrobiales bacterium]|nr:Lrp/AsnC family transcriptional regulator [Verrucomicrobiales bacterium]